MLRQARQFTSRFDQNTARKEYAQKATLHHQDLEFGFFGKLIINQLIAGTGRDPGLKISSTETKVY